MRALIDSAGALCFFLFIKRERREQPVDGSGQLGGQSLRADDRVPHGIAREKAEHGDGARSRYPMAIGAPVIRLAIVLVDDEFERHRLKLKPELERLLSRARHLGVR